LPCTSIIEVQAFNRAETRYDKVAAMSMPIATRRSIDPKTGSWLLEPVLYSRQGALEFG